MLSGQTSVYIDPTKTGEEPQPETDPQQTEQQHSQLQAADSSNMAEKLTAATEHKKTGNRVRFGKHIGTYDAGKSFGEFALIKKDAVRNATIIADEDTDTMAIDRDVYGDTLKAKQEEEYKEQSAFVNSCRLFKSCSNKLKKLLEMSVRKMVLPYGTTIVRQGHSVEGLHFIIKGEAKVLVDPSTHKAQYPKLYDPSNTALARELGKVFKKKEERKRDTVQQEQIRVRRREGFVAAEKRLYTKTTTLSVIKEGAVIGDAEVSLGLDTYAYTVVSTANTQVFLLDNKNIERFILKKHTSTLNRLRKNVLKSLLARKKSKVGTDLELYTHMIEALEGLKPKKTSDDSDGEEAEAPTINNNNNLKKADVSDLVQLYLQNKAPLIAPHVPGTVYYKLKSVQKARKRMMDRLRKYETNKVLTHQVRLERARKAAKRQPRSRRELERLTVAQDPEEMSRLYDKDHAVNRFFSMKGSPGNAGARPHTAIGASRMMYTDNNIFKLTEPQVDDDCNIHDVDYSDLNEEDVKQIVKEVDVLHDTSNASRALVIKTMMDKSASSKPVTLVGGLRPKSAPVFGGWQGKGKLVFEDDEDAFDVETSNRALEDLEAKIKAFHQKHEIGEGRRNSAPVTKLKRFTITKPDDVPVPGGTVFVRQRECTIPTATDGTSNGMTSQHQHIRRFIIPKDAINIASKALATLENESQEDLSVAGNNSVKIRPKSCKSDMSRLQRPKTGFRKLSQQSSLS